MQQLPVITPINVFSSERRGTVYKDILEVAETDYLFMLRGIAAQEIGAQARLGNPLTSVVVDGGTTKGIDEAERSVFAYFADRQSLADAITDARDALMANGRRVTGGTLGHLQFHYSIGKGGAVVGVPDVRALVAQIANPSSLDLYVALPVVHARKWQWLSHTGGRMYRRSHDKQRGFDRGTGKMRMVSKSVFEQSAAQVQRRFKNLDVKPFFLGVPNLNINGWTAVDRIPAIKVCIKTRGRGRNG